MSHAQQQILEAVQAALVDGLPPGRLVALDRMDPLAPRELPAVLVQEAPSGESVAPGTVSSLEQRELDVLVSCVVAQGSGYAAAARELGRQVEAILGAPRLSKPLTRTRLLGSRLALAGEAEDALASREQTWRITYFTRRGEPDQPH
ncbi:hypothetical protein [Pseudacidovorax intermedius]|mgnify:CR=1 FL=1|uniref:hypothetical protein n=1 Tax=Pseudacidovorax intermedius TaxID=433924 RepID=UPI0026EB33A4|nr:hypothetical protein [Pseudacidovorax intermedius]